MIGTMKRTLDITKHGIDPGKSYDFHTLMAATSYNYLMKYAGLSNTAETEQ